MKVQVINTLKGKRYVLLDDQYKPIEVVNKYLKFLDNLGKSQNTQRTYAYDLLLYCQFMQKKEISLLDLCSNPDRGPIDILSEFVMWLQYPDYSNGILHIDKEECASRSMTTYPVG